MTFTYKIKYYKNEEGEYTTSAPCDSGLIGEFIERHWTNIKGPIEVELITITNSEGRSIILEHAAKEVFEVYYLPQNKYLHYHKKSRFALIQEVMDSFFANDIVWLENNLNKTKFEDGEIRGDFISKNFEYKFSNKLSPVTLFCVSFGMLCLIILVFLIFNMRLGPEFIFFATCLLIVAVPYIIPSVLLHWQYRSENKDLIIWISKGEDALVIELSGIKKRFWKSDIRQVTSYKTHGYRIPWSDYEYTELEFKSGEIINLTNLLINQDAIQEKFLGHYIDFIEKKTGLPTIKRKMSIKF